MKKSICISLMILMMFSNLDITFGISIQELKNVSVQSIVNNTATASFALSSDDETKKAIMTDLINEMRPFLKDIIGDDVNMSSEEILKKIMVHPIKFLTALYNYVIYSIKEIFNVAAENSVIEVKVDK